MKVKDIVILDVKLFISIVDIMIVVSGIFNWYVKLIVENVCEKVKYVGFIFIGIEGEEVVEWVLVDLGDIIVYIMLLDICRFYDLEKFWSMFFDN